MPESNGGSRAQGKGSMKSKPVEVWRSGDLLDGENIVVWSDGTVDLDGCLPSHLLSPEEALCLQVQLIQATAKAMQLTEKGRELKRERQGDES